MKGAIISVGDELLIGQVVNTNAAFIAGALNRVGVDIRRVVTVADEIVDIVETLKAEFSSHEVVIVTGGLGPTHDDITRRAASEFLGVGLASSDEARRSIEDLFAARGRPWSRAAEDQTMVLEGARIIPNRQGTAPGQLLEREGRALILLPGVPHEMEGMVLDFLVPHFRKSQKNFILHRTLNTTGIAESALGDLLGDLSKLLGSGKLAFLPSASGVRLRISVSGGEEAACGEEIKTIESRVRARAEKYIYGADAEELEAVVGRILSERNLTLAVAESCTGGLLADKLTDVPGISRSFLLGIVAYSDETKTGLLKISPAILKRHGAVSREVAEAMASSVRHVAGASIGISTTGIAGPSGGTPEKPVGLVWIGFSDENTTFARQANFGNDRRRVKERGVQACLDLLRRRILGLE